MQLLLNIIDDTPFYKTKVACKVVQCILGFKLTHKSDEAITLSYLCSYNIRHWWDDKSEHVITSKQ